MSKQPPLAPTASVVGPCPTAIRIVGRPALEVYPAPSHHPTAPKLMNYLVLYSCRCLCRTTSLMTIASDGGEGGGGGAVFDH